MSNEATALYRHFGDDDVLLYVGISSSVMRRTSAHSRHSEWMSSTKKITVEWFGSRSKALEAERNAIRNEGPIHNVKHALRGDAGDESVEDYLNASHQGEAFNSSLAPEVDLDDMFTVAELAARYPRVMSQSTLRYQLRDRDKNGLDAVCVQLGKKLLISNAGYRRWLAASQAKSRHAGAM